MDCVGLDFNQTQEAREFFRSSLQPVTTVFSFVHGYFYVPLCVLGVLSNIAIIVVLLRPAMRKSPFNVLLMLIAVCDGFLMATYLVYKHVEFCHPWFFSHAWVLYTKFYALMSVFVHSASLWITVNMAVLRYLVLYRGSRSTSRLPPCNGFGAALIAIVIGIGTAFVGSLPNMLRYEIRFNSMRLVPRDCLHSRYANSWTAQDEIPVYDFDRPSWWNCSWERANFWIVAWMLKLIPCILLTIFMTLLVRMLIEARERRSRLCGGVATGNSQAERTTAMLTVIVAVFLLTELPQGLLTLAAGVNPRLMMLTPLLGNAFDLLSLINSAVNFVLCALMSHVFRREFLRTFSVCCFRSMETQTRQTSLKQSQMRNSRTAPRSPRPGDNSYVPMLPDKTYE